MSDVRANSGVPVLAQFAGVATPSACAPLVVDSATGIIYSLKTGDVVVAAGASGTVTSIAQTFTGGIVSVGGSPITTTGTLALTVAGTSGGIPYFSGATTWATSAALAASSLVIGGGAGTAPSTVTTGANVLTALGVAVGTDGAFVVKGGALGSPSSAGTIPAFTLGGTIAGGGNQINNVVIGTSTPLAGSFTTLNASGNAVLSGTNTQPNQPGFLVISGDTANITGDATSYTIVFGTEVFDNGNNYNNSNGVFTAPITGKYQFNVTLIMEGLLSTHTKGVLALVTSNRTHTLFNLNPFAIFDATDGVVSLSGSTLADMDVSDTAWVTLVVAGGTKVVDISTGTRWSCYLAL